MKKKWKSGWRKVYGPAKIKLDEETVSAQSLNDPWGHAEPRDGLFYKGNFYLKVKVRL